MPAGPLVSSVLSERGRWEAMTRRRVPDADPRATPSRSPGRAERLRAVLERDGATCIWCARPFTGLVTPTTEHVVPRVKGGPSWLENEVAACSRCNAGRGHRSPADWLEECRRRGWTPDVARLARALEGLAAAIARQGGQRRARPYLDAQVRRLRRDAATGSAVVPG
jgi:5-methylcytosine-specific restriction endonuclease McrA